jgi:hypothetical protein
MRGVWFDVSIISTDLSVFFVTMDGSDSIAWCNVIVRFTGSYISLFDESTLYITSFGIYRGFRYECAFL